MLMKSAPTTPNSKPLRRGFSLIEMAMVLVVAGLMVSFGLKATQGRDDCYATTSNQLRTIQTAMDQFVDSNRRYPVPAGSAIGPNDPLFGKEASTSPLSPSIDQTAGAVPEYVGSLPFQALGLPISFAADCWGNQFTYMVTPTLTDTTGFKLYSNTGTITVGSGSRITGTLLTGKAAYAVISHGADALGASGRNYVGAKIHCDQTATPRIDAENCDINNNLVFTSTFNNGNNPNNFFDDIIIYAEKPCTLSDSDYPACPAGLSRCNDGDWCSQPHDGVPGMPVGSCYKNVYNATDEWGPSGASRCTWNVETPFQIANFQVSVTYANKAILDKATCTVSIDPAWTYQYSRAKNVIFSRYYATTMTTYPMTNTFETISPNGMRFSSPPPAWDLSFLDSNWLACVPGCPAKTITWGGNCTADAPAGLDTVTSTQYNTAPGYAGSINLTCNAGTYVTSGGTCTPQPVTCPATTFNWGAGCTGVAPQSGNGSTSIPNTASGFNGSANVTCLNGVYTKTSDTCVPTDCPAQTVSWGGGNCSAPIGHTYSGGTTTITNTLPIYKGTADVLCSNSTLTIVRENCDTTPTCTCVTTPGYCSGNDNNEVCVPDKTVCTGTGCPTTTTTTIDYGVIDHDHSSIAGDPSGSGGTTGGSNDPSNNGSSQSETESNE